MMEATAQNVEASVAEQVAEVRAHSRIHRSDCEFVVVVEEEPIDAVEYEEQHIERYWIRVEKQKGVVDQWIAEMEPVLVLVDVVVARFVAFGGDP